MMCRSALYRDLYRSMLERTDGWTASEWAAGVLDDVATGRRDITAMRHPLGFVCIPVERVGAHGVCVHVWSDDLPAAVPTTSSMHAHSWELVSYVLYGSLRNEVIEVTDDPDYPTHRVFEVHSGGELDEVRKTPRLVRCGVKAAEVNRRGDTYSLPAGIFHATVVRGDAATVALGSGRREGRDLSLGQIGTGTHQVRRRRCDPEETARAARVVTERLADLHS